jgi:hypothetical protein
LVLALGSAGAAVAWYLDPGRSAVGPLPGEGLSLPAETRFLAGLDVPRFVASPFYERARKGAGTDALAEIEKHTGLDPERDVDTLVIAGQGGASAAGGLVLVKGRFDRYKVTRAIEQEKKAVTWKQQDGVTIYVLREGKKDAGALAFLSDDVFVIGDQRAVERMVSGRAAGKADLRGNEQLMGLLGQVRAGATFWAVGDQTALSHAPRSLPGARGASLPLPGLKSVVLTGDLDPLIAVELTGEAEDEKAARGLGDVVKGFVALATLQASSKPELGELAQSVSVTTDGTRVQVSARVPYTLLDALEAKPAAASAPIASR